MEKDRECCMRHKEVQGEYYCKECKSALCARCINSHIKTHTIMELPTLSDSLRIRFKNQISFIDARLTRLDKFIKGIKTITSELSTKWVNIEEQFNKRLENLDKLKNSTGGQQREMRHIFDNRNYIACFKMNTIIEDLRKSLQESRPFQYKMTDIEQLKAILASMKKLRGLIAEFGEETEEEWKEDCSPLLHTPVEGENRIVTIDTRNEMIHSEKVLSKGEIFNECMPFVQLGNIIYISGGYNKKSKLFTDSMIEVDPLAITPTFTQCEGMHIPKGYHSLTLHRGEHIYSVGGHSNQYKAMNIVERYDIKEDHWDLLPQLKQGRYSASVTILDPYIYVIGGFDDKKILNTIERMNLYSEDDIWTTLICTLPNPLRGAFSFPFNHNTILISGGSLSSTGKNSAEVTYGKACFMLNVTEGEVKKSEGWKLEKKDVFYQRNGIIWDHKIYISGYEDDDIHIFDTEEEKWTCKLEGDLILDVGGAPSS